MQYHPFLLEERRKGGGPVGRDGKETISQDAKRTQNMPLDAT